MTIYNEKEHAKNLIRILELDDTCNKCVFGRIYTRTDQDNICSICRAFIGIPTKKLFGDPKCPCYVLGKDEATKRSWIALEEGGYLDD